jgi:hypothetical protein
MGPKIIRIVSRCGRAAPPPRQYHLCHTPYCVTDADAYLAHLRSTAHRSPNTLAQLLSVPIDLNRHSRRVTLGGFACSPWSGRSAYRIVGYQEHLGERGNRTPRIPEAVVTPLLRWAIRYVDVFSPDIIAARAELEALKRARGQDEPASSVRLRLTSYLNKRASCSRGIPMLSSPAVGGPRRFGGIREPAINYPLIALQLGCRKEVLVQNQEGCRQAIVNACRHLGPEMGELDTAPSVDPETQRPWRDRFDHRSLAHEENMLQAACYIICAYLSGMRDSEQAMRSGCHVVTRSESPCEIDGRAADRGEPCARGGGVARDGVPSQWAHHRVSFDSAKSSRSGAASLSIPSGTYCCARSADRRSKAWRTQRGSRTSPPDRDDGAAYPSPHLVDR